MAELKTKKTTASVAALVKAVASETQRKDCQTLKKMMEEVTKTKAKMWGPSIVGFGSYHYKYASGKEGDWPLAGFSPRKKELSVYIDANLIVQEARLIFRRRQCPRHVQITLEPHLSAADIDDTGELNWLFLGRRSGTTTTLVTAGSQDSRHYE